MSARSPEWFVTQDFAPDSGGIARRHVELCRRLRASGSQVLVLMLTARDATEDRVAGLDSGADDYVSKPFAFRELVARVEAVLRRASKQEQAPCIVK